MVDIAELGFKVDTGSLTDANKALDDFFNNVKRIADGLEQTRKPAQNSNRELTLFGRAVGEIKSQMVALAGNLGFVGTALAGFGPAGLAAAAGLEATLKVITAISEASDRVATKASALSNLSVVTGVTAERLQALRIAGEEVGIGAERVDLVIRRFTLSLADARDRAGPLYDAIVKIDAGLADQLVRTKTVEQALNLLAQAYRRAADDSKRAELARPITGRDIAAGAILGVIGEQGGVDAILEQQKKSIALTNDETVQYNKLRNEIEKLERETRDLWDKLVASPEQLERNKRWLETWKEGFQVLQQMKAQGFKDTLFNVLDNINLGGLHQSFNRLRLEAASRSGGNPGLFGVTSLGGEFGFDPTRSGGRLSPSESGRFLGSANPNGPIANFPINEAARAAEETKKLADAQEKNKQSTIAAYNEYRAYIAVLGPAARTDELKTAKTLELNAAQAANLKITNEMKERAREAYAVQLGAADVAIRVQNAAATPTELYAQKIRELNLLVRQYKLSQDEANVSLQAYAKQVEQTVKQMEVMKAALPGLKQLELDSRDLRQQIDRTASGFVNDLGSAFADVATQSKTASQAIQDLERNFIRSLTNMIFQMTIAAPLARSLQGLFGGFFTTGVQGNNALDIYGIANAFVGGRATGGPVPPGSWAIAGENGPEPVFGGMAGATVYPASALTGGGSGTVVNVITPPGTTAEKEQRQEGGVSITDIIISTVNEAGAKGRFDGMNRVRYGLPVRARPRG